MLLYAPYMIYVNHVGSVEQHARYDSSGVKVLFSVQKKVKPSQVTYEA
jgi:hypothetical protein